MKNIIILSLATALSGCSILHPITPYQPMKSIGGYDDVQLDETTWRVRAKVNNNSNISRADDIALLRASEIACQNGYRGFEIINQAYGRGYSVKDTTITVQMKSFGGVNAPTVMKQLSEKLDTKTGCEF